MATNTLKENKMGVMPVGKLLANMALPMILSMLIQALYNVVDSIYVSQISESAVTALSLAFPVQNMQIAFAVGIGVGVNSLLSKSLGERNQEAANRTAGNGLVMMCIVYGAFLLFGLFGTRPYYELQSTVAETVEGGIAYTSICCIFSLGIFIEILSERLLQSTGRTVSDSKLGVKIPLPMPASMSARSHQRPSSTSSRSGCSSYEPMTAKMFTISLSICDSNS